MITRKTDYESDLVSDYEIRDLWFHNHLRTVIFPAQTGARNLAKRILLLREVCGLDPYRNRYIVFFFTNLPVCNVHGNCILAKA